MLLLRNEVISVGRECSSQARVCLGRMGIRDYAVFNDATKMIVQPEDCPQGKQSM